MNLWSKSSIARTGAFFAFFAVVMGAFGAHALAPLLDSRATEIYRTAVLYQIFHSLAILLLAALHDSRNVKSLRICFSSFAIGILFFSGSLYALALTELRFLGMLTPIGGVLFLIGWGALLMEMNSKGRT